MSYMGAVEVQGPKWCGKTETAKQIAESTLFLQDPDTYERNMAAAETMPSLLLRGEKPRLIDEWQEAPQLWDAVRFSIDQNGEAGQFILTGSAVPSKKKPRHTGTGRFGFLRMRPMSLFESKESTGEVSLSSLFGGAEAAGVSRMSLEDTAYATARGGWPRAVVLGREGRRRESLSIVKEYVSAVCDKDISRVDDVSRNPDKARMLLRAYARSSAAQVPNATLQQDMEKSGQELSAPTLAEYLGALKQIFVTDELHAWSPKLRSKSAIRTSPTRHFVDPSIAVAALGASPDSLLDDIPTFGLVFESLCARDLRIYVERLGGAAYHYRDNTGLEVDLILVLDTGDWAAVEIKLGDARVEDGARSLQAFASRVDQEHMRPPAFLAVVTAGTYAYTRDDGVHVIAIGCMKP